MAVMYVQLKTHLTRMIKNIFKRFLFAEMNALHNNLACSHGFPCNFHTRAKRWLKSVFLTKSLLTECDYVSFDSKCSLLVRVIFVENCRQNMLQRRGGQF
jgi:hypothetical protein